MIFKALICGRPIMIKYEVLFILPQTTDSGFPLSKTTIQESSVQDDASVYSFKLMRGCLYSESQIDSSIRKDGRYTEKDAAVIVRQMLRVAAQCHLHGLVHRDMKPEGFCD